MKLIDKAAVVGEIVKCYNECLKRAKIIDAEYWNGKADAYRDMLVILSILEVKDFWKSADGKDLPDIDRDVIVLTQPYPLKGSEYAVSFAHRPNPNGWDGKSVTTGEVEHYTPKTYDKGGWNIPDVKWWLDIELPKMKE